MKKVNAGNTANCGKTVNKASKAAKMNKNTRTGIAFAAASILGIGGIGVALSLKGANDHSDKVYYVTIPRVVTTVADEDGLVHKVNADLTIAIRGAQPNYDERQRLSTAIASALSDVSYEDLSGEDKVNTVKEVVKVHMAQEYDDGIVEEVYTLNLLNDGELAPQENPPWKLDDLYRGLFPNYE